MKNKMIGGLLSLALLAAAAGAMAEGPKPGKKAEAVEKTGVIQVIPADQARKEKYNTVLLKVGEETIKLIPARDKKDFKKLEALDGKTVTVTGEYLPANPPKYPLAAIKVQSFAEVKKETKK